MLIGSWLTGLILGGESAYRFLVGTGLILSLVKADKLPFVFQFDLPLHFLLSSSW